MTDEEPTSSLLRSNNTANCKHPRAHNNRPRVNTLKIKNNMGIKTPAAQPLSSGGTAF